MEYLAVSVTMIMLVIILSLLLFQVIFWIMFCLSWLYRHGHDWLRGVAAFPVYERRLPLQELSRWYRPRGMSPQSARNDIVNWKEEGF